MCSLDPDNSTLYIREGGQLRRVNDIVLAEPKPVSSCRRTKPLLLKKEHFIFTYNAKGNLQYSPRSLFDISLQFIAENIHHVDSLLDFPEQIGVKLFAATEEKCVFSNQETGPKALQVFNDAYGDMVLTSLCLRNRYYLRLCHTCDYLFTCPCNLTWLSLYTSLQVSSVVWEDVWNQNIS